MVDLTDVATGAVITSARQNLINDYIQDGTHKINTLSIDVGGTEVVSSARKFAGTFPCRGVTYVVGAGGDYTTIADALAALGTNEGTVLVRSEYMNVGNAKYTLYSGQWIVGETGSGIATFIDCTDSSDAGTAVFTFELNSKDSGTTTSTSENHLVQTGQNFTSTVSIGDTVHNTTDDTYAEVTQVNSNTDLTLDTDIMTSGEAFVVGTRCFGAGIRNIHLSGNNAGWSKGIRMAGCRDCRLENVRIYNFNGSAIYFNDAWDVYIHACEFNVCGSVAHTEATIHMVAGTNDYYHCNNEIKFSQCLFESDHWKAIYIGDMSLANKWNSCKIHGLPVNYNTVEMSGTQVEKQSFTDCTFVNQGTATVLTITGQLNNGGNNVVNGCTFVGNLGACINVAGTGHVLTGNTFRNNDGKSIVVTGTKCCLTGNASSDWRTSGDPGTIEVSGNTNTVTGNSCVTMALSGNNITATGNVATTAFSCSGTDCGVFGNVNGTVTMSETNGQYLSKEYTDTVSASAWTNNWAKGNVHYVLLGNGAQTITMTNPKAGARYVIALKQPASGAAGTVTWADSANILWSGGSAPTLTATNGKTDLVTLVYSTAVGKYLAGASLNY